jgi:multicomponent Na+:H+ antiporter subunit G
MTLVMDTAGALFIAVGVALIGIGGIGLIRLPDAYNRLNAVAKAAGLGLVSILFGALLLMPGWTTAATLGVAIVLQLLTAPVGAYAIAASAYRSGTPLATVTRYDEYLGGGRPADRPGSAECAGSGDSSDDGERSGDRPDPGGDTADGVAP